MSVPVFEAHALPSGFEVPAAPSLKLREDGVTLSYPAATPAWLGELARVLTDAGGALARRSVAEIAASLGRVGERFLDDRDPWRREAIELIPVTSGLSRKMAAAVLDGMARDWTEARLLQLLEVDLPCPGVLDGFSEVRGRRTMALGPKLCVQIAAGGVPGVGVHALLRSLLVKGPTLLKPSRGDVVLPVLFARALREDDPDLAAALAVVYWKGGSRSLERAALGRADLVVVYGSDETVAELRAEAPPHARFLTYGHRVSAGVVGRDALRGERSVAVAAEVARAVAMFDQRGCVSPRLVLVEHGGEVSPEVFSVQVGFALSELEDSLPGGRLDPEEASRLQQIRGTSELLAASGSGVRVTHGGPAAWTVVCEEASGPLPGAVGRVLTVRPFGHIDDIPGALAQMSGSLQTVGVAGLGIREEILARLLGGMGACRLAPFSEVAFPPPWWHHDGGSPLGDLVRWIDLDSGGPR